MTDNQQAEALPPQPQESSLGDRPLRRTQLTLGRPLERRPPSTKVPDSSPVAAVQTRPKTNMPLIPVTADGAAGFSYAGPVVQEALTTLLTNHYLAGATIERDGDILRLRITLPSGAPYGAYQSLLGAARLLAERGALQSLF